jgi:hypothetical protein
MKLKKETLKRIIKEEMMQVMREMDFEQTNGKPETLEDFKTRLEAESDRFKIEKDHRDPEALSIETSTDSWTASVDEEGDLILDFDNSNSEQIVGKDAALEFLLSLY